MAKQINIDEDLIPEDEIRTPIAPLISWTGTLIILAVCALATFAMSYYAHNFFHWLRGE